MKILSSLLFIVCSILVYSQEISNNLTGNFVSKNKKSIYSSIQFMGNGKASINEMDEYDFVERNDSIIIIVDKTVFIFQKNKTNEIKGISDWVNGDVFKSKDKTFQYVTSNPKGKQRAQWLSEYFDINYKNPFNFESIDIDNLDQVMGNLKVKNEKLCNQDFDLSCTQVFALTLTEAIGGFGAFLNSNMTETLAIKPDAALEKLGEKIIRLGNPEGYGLLSQYYALINNPTKAQSYKETGLEQGCKLCLEIEMNELINNLQQTEN